MIYALMGYVHAAVKRRVGEIRALAGERGQGTVEYVGLILLVSLLMVGMVAAMKGFNRSERKGRYHLSRTEGRGTRRGISQENIPAVCEHMFVPSLRTRLELWQTEARLSGPRRLGTPSRVATRCPPAALIATPRHLLRDGGG